LAEPTGGNRVKSMEAELRSLKIAELRQDLGVGIEQLDYLRQAIANANANEKNLQHILKIISTSDLMRLERKIDRLTEI
jgi:hypothetical protein